MHFNAIDGTRVCTDGLQRICMCNKR